MPDDLVKGQCPYCGAVCKGKEKAFSGKRKCPKCKREVLLRILKQPEHIITKEKEPIAAKPCIVCDKPTVATATLCQASQSDEHIDRYENKQCTFCSSTDDIVHAEQFHRVQVLDQKETDNWDGTSTIQTTWRYVDCIEGAICKACSEAFKINNETRRKATWKRLSIGSLGCLPLIAIPTTISGWNEDGSHLGIPFIWIFCLLPYFIIWTLKRDMPAKLTARKILSMKLQEKFKDEQNNGEVMFNKSKYENFKKQSNAQEVF